MKNIIISGLSTYIFIGLCEVKNIFAFVVFFFLVWAVCLLVEESVKGVLHE